MKIQYKRDVTPPRCPANGTQILGQPFRVRRQSTLRLSCVSTPALTLIKGLDDRTDRIPKRHRPEDVDQGNLHYCSICDDSIVGDSQNDWAEMHERGASTEDGPSPVANPLGHARPMDSGKSPESAIFAQNPPDQSGSGLTYAGKSKTASPPGIRTPKKRRKAWIKFWTIYCHRVTKDKRHCKGRTFFLYI